MLFTCAISGDRRVDGRVHGLRLRRARRVHLRQLPLAQAVKPLQGVLFDMVTLLNDNISYHFSVTQIYPEQAGPVQPQLPGLPAACRIRRGNVRRRPQQVC